LAGGEKYLRAADERPDIDPAAITTGAQEILLGDGVKGILGHHVDPLCLREELIGIDHARDVRSVVLGWVLSHRC
jgi:hypothetical protein